jgi:hypothetical protein
MRNISIGILIGLMITAPFAFTQQPLETIFIEAPLQIGMAKDTALSRIAEQGLTLSKAGNQESWFIVKKNDRGEYDALGSVAFTDSRLSWASKTWATGSDAESAKLARSSYFLVKSFEDRGTKSCVIETKKTRVAGFGQQAAFNSLWQANGDTVCHGL